jgi:hypothetical protein
MSLRTITRPFVDFTHRRFVEGSEEDRKRAHEEAHQEIRAYQQAQLALKSGLPEIPLNQLKFARFGQVEDTASGDLYQVIRGLVDGDPKRCGAAAWFVDGGDNVIWLKRPASGPQTRAELEQQQAEREARRNAPKPKPEWMR